MSTNWARRRPWSKAPRPKPRRVVEMTPEELAAHLANVARRQLAKEAAIAAMTPEQRAVFDTRQAQKREKVEARSRKRADARARALATLEAHVDGLYMPNDLPRSERETPVPQSEATMRGIPLAEFARPNGARALVLLREWNGELRILFTLGYVENGRAVRSRGWTLYLREATADGEVIQSTRELRALYETMGLLLARLESGDSGLLANVVQLQGAREQSAEERRELQGGKHGPG
jgi:hypothetical protein